MTQGKTESAETGPRRPWVAFILGYFPGLGHLYVSGLVSAMIALAISWCLVLPAMVLVKFLLAWSPAAVISGFVLQAIIWSLVPLHALLLARRRRLIALGRWQRWWIYLAYAIVVSLAHPNVMEVIGKRLWLRTFIVPAASMSPTILEGEWIMADMRQGARSRSQPGDIAVFEHPDDETWRTKRIVAQSGQTVEIRGTILHVDGKPKTNTSDRNSPSELLDERFDGCAYRVRHQRPVRPFGPVTVPDGTVFLLGDNRGASSDSRQWGPLPRDLIRGVAYRIYWSRDPVTGGVRWNRLGKSIDSCSVDAGNPRKN